MQKEIKIEKKNMNESIGVTFRRFIKGQFHCKPVLYVSVASHSQIRWHQLLVKLLLAMENPFSVTVSDG